MRPKNIDAAIELIEKYRSANLADIKNRWHENRYYESYIFHDWTLARYIANMFTGFGNCQTCKLCTSAVDGCNTCIYDDINKCNGGIHLFTYLAIENAQSPEELHQAFLNRADHIEKHIQQWLDT